MALTREELQRLLAKFEADMPAMMAAHPDHADFNQVCAERADEITDAASVKDDAWAFEEIDRILEKFGLWRPDGNDLPPDE